MIPPLAECVTCRIMLVAPARLLAGSFQVQTFRQVYAYSGGGPSATAANSFRPCEDRRFLCVQNLVRYSPGESPLHLLATRSGPAAAHVLLAPALFLLRSLSPDSQLAAGSRSVAAGEWLRIETRHPAGGAQRWPGSSGSHPRRSGRYRLPPWPPTALTPPSVLRL